MIIISKRETDGTAVVGDIHPASSNVFAEHAAWLDLISDTDCDLTRHIPDCTTTPPNGCGTELTAEASRSNLVEPLKNDGARL